MKAALFWITSLFAGLSNAADGQTVSMLSGRGIWVQSPSALSTADLDALKTFGARRLHFMVTSFRPYRTCSENARLTLKAKAEQLIQLMKQAQDRGFKVVATIYVPPAKSAIEWLLAKEGAIAGLVDGGVDGLEYDLEGEWSKSKVCGYTDHRDAVRQIVLASHGLRKELPVGVTTHLGRAGDSRIGMEYFDWLALQAYSTCSLAKGCAAYEHKSHGPGYKQAFVTGATSAFKGPIVVGLAAYHQKWPGHTVSEAMERSLNAVVHAQNLDQRIVGHSYWSSSWLQAGSPQVEFLKSTTSLSP